MFDAPLPHKRLEVANNIRSTVIGTERPAMSVLSFGDECFVLSVGSPKTPHAGESARFSSETIIWGYKEIRKRRCYWREKKLFVQRIFRSANIALYQRKREDQYHEGLVASAVMCMVGRERIWVGNCGKTAAYCFGSRTLKLLTKMSLTPALLGVVRYGLVAQMATRELGPEESILLTSSPLESREFGEVERMLKEKMSHEDIAQMLKKYYGALSCILIKRLRD